MDTEEGESTMSRLGRDDRSGSRQTIDASAEPIVDVRSTDEGVLVLPDEGQVFVEALDSVEQADDAEE